MKNEPDIPPISRSLRALSDAIDALAVLLDSEGTIDKTKTKNEFTVLVNKFSKTISTVKPKTANKKENKPLPGKEKNKIISDQAAQINKLRHKDFLKSWLYERGIIVTAGENVLNSERYLNATTTYLIEHYKYLQPFLKELRLKQHLKENFEYKPNHLSIDYIKGWCRMLHQQHLIDSYLVKKSGEVFVDVSTIHEATNYIFGNWLEIYLRKVIRQIVKSNLSALKSFDILSQAQIELPDGTKSELDLLIMINDQVLWFECKSSKIGDYYKKYAERRVILGLSGDHSLLIIPDDNDQLNVQIKNSTGMTPLAATNMFATLTQILF